MENVKKEPSNREQYSLRIPSKLKEQLEQEANRKGYSLNTYIIMKLEN